MSAPAKKNPLKIEYIEVKTLVAYDRNARTHSPEQVDQIAASISEFGFTNPILIDENKIIIAGHGRLEAAKKLNLSEVPTITLHGLTETQRRAYVLADNKLALNAGWDANLLQEEMQFLANEDFDLKIMGWSDIEVTEILDADLNGDATKPGDENEIIEPVKDPIVKKGDVWILGHHRLLCGDATSPADVKKLLAGRKPNLMVSDPPYGVEYKADWRSTAKGRVKTDREKTSDIQNDNRADWQEAWDLFEGGGGVYLARLCIY